MKTNIVHYKDARNMAEVDDNSVRLIITSPPYWNIKDYSLNGTQDEKHSEKVEGQIGDVSDYAEYLNEMVPVWKECERILIPNGRLCINTPLMPVAKEVLTTHYNRHIVDINAGIQNTLLRDTGLFLFDTYIWNRTNWSKSLVWGSYPYPPNIFVRNAIEFITVYVKDGDPLKIDKEIKEKSKLGQEDFLNFTHQVWNIPVPNKSDKAYGKHTAIMPRQIVERLIYIFSFHGDIVLDPFTGSGTTLEVAQRLGRRYVGYEIYKSYEKIINNKLDQSQLDFDKSISEIAPDLCPCCGQKIEI